MDTCYSCAAPLAEHLANCQYCGTAKGSQPEDEILVPKTPFYAFILALLVGLTLPLAAIAPVWLYGYLGGTFAMLVPLFGIAAGFYVTGYICGRRWPDTSPWSWSVFIIAPFAIACLTSGMIPGVLFIFPPYFGAKRGRRRWLPTDGTGA